MNNIRIVYAQKSITISTILVHLFSSINQSNYLCVKGSMMICQNLVITWLLKMIHKKEV